MKRYYLNPHTHLMTKIKSPHTIIPGIRTLSIFEVRKEVTLQEQENKLLINKTKTNMNLLNKLLNRVGDKGVHYSICFMFSLIITLVILFISGSYWSGILSGLYAGTGLGIGKEYGDAKAHWNHWDWGDIIVDMLGTISGTAIALFIYWIF